MTPAELELRWLVGVLVRDVLRTMSEQGRREACRAIDASLRAWENEQVASGQRERGSPLRHHEDSAHHLFAQRSGNTTRPASSSLLAYSGTGSTAETFYALVDDDFAPAVRVTKKWLLPLCTALLARREVKQMPPTSLGFVLQVLWYYAWEGKRFFKDEVRDVRASKARHRRQIKDARLGSERERKNNAEQERRTALRYADEIVKELPGWVKREVLAELVHDRMKAAGEEDVPDANRIYRRLRYFPWPEGKRRSQRTARIA